MREKVKRVNCDHCDAVLEFSWREPAKPLDAAKIAWLGVIPPDGYTTTQTKCTVTGVLAPGSTWPDLMLFF